MCMTVWLVLSSLYLVFQQTKGPLDSFGDAVEENLLVRRGRCKQVMDHVASHAVVLKEVITCTLLPTNGCLPSEPFCVVGYG